MEQLFKSNLVKNVMISYIFMIVFPVMIVLGISFALASKYIYRAATDSIQVAQDTIVDLYKEEKRSTAISLSRVVNMSSEMVISQITGTEKEEKKEALEQLDNVYQLLAAPEYKLLDIQIYCKDGTTIIPRWELQCSLDELRQKQWYQNAVENPGQVSTALVNEEYFYRIRSSEEAIMVSAIVPDNVPEIECVVLYKISKMPDALKKYNKDGSMGQFFLVNQYGISQTQKIDEVIIPDYVMDKIRKNEKQQISYGGIRYLIKSIPDDDLYLVSVIDEGEMFGQFRLFAVVCLTVISCVVLMFIVYFKQLIYEREQMEKEKYEEELQALQSQMNPHFLMNTLNTLKFMAISAHFDGMRDMVTALENILAAVLNRDGGFYFVEDEESVLNSYIYIMQFRYMESFEVEIKISQEARKCRIPKLILQPVVENSITHGFDGLEERQGKIEITGYIKKQVLFLEVLDNGKGLEADQIFRIFDETCQEMGRKNIGIQNTNRRLKLNFGEAYGVSIESKLGVYTKVTLSMPAINE